MTWWSLTFSRHLLNFAFHAGGSTFYDAQMQAEVAKEGRVSAPVSAEGSSSRSGTHPAADAQATPAPASFKCPAPGCTNPATMQCPECIKLHIPGVLSHFCGPECFKKMWPAHRLLHQPRPWVSQIAYTGPLRPALVCSSHWLCCAQSLCGMS